VRLALLAALCVALTACGDSAGGDAAQAACRAYGQSAGSIAEGVELRTTATDQAQRAADADDGHAALKRDMDDAWGRSDAMATAHNSGQEVSADDLNAYFAADKQVRADCADAGADLGPLKP
jgi:hypothetical protein